jgi:hypothetical protein
LCDCQHARKDNNENFQISVVGYLQFVETKHRQAALCSTGYGVLEWQGLSVSGRGQLKCDGARAENRFRLSPKRTSPFKSAGASVQSTAGSRGLRISGSNTGYTMFRGSVKSTGYPLHSPVSPSPPLPCVTVCHHISTGVYRNIPTRMVQ